MTTGCELNASQFCPPQGETKLAERVRRTFGVWMLGGYLAILLSMTAHPFAARASVIAPTLGGGLSLMLAWQPSPNPSVVAYKLYYGSAVGQYTNVIAVGNVTSAMISGLTPGAAYYFAATAVDFLGQESFLSVPAGYVMPAVVMSPPAMSTDGGGYTVSGTGRVGHIFIIQTSTNLVAWRSIGAQTAGSDGTFTFTDSSAGAYRCQFYRAQDMQQ